MEEDGSLSAYPEHEKLKQFNAGYESATQAVGDFLEWIASQQSARLMVFAEWIEEFKITCPNTHFTAGGIAHCEVCDENGSAATSEKKSGWVPAAGSLTGWLADWSGVDLAKLEAEKRAMLDAIRAQNLTTEPKAASA